MDDNSGTSLRLLEKAIVFQRKNTQTIEERGFCAALITLEGHFERMPAFGSRTSVQAKKIIQDTLERTLNSADARCVVPLGWCQSMTDMPCREAIAKCVDVWMRLRRIMLLAVPRLVARTLRETYADTASPAGLDVPESATLIIKHYDSIVEDLGILSTLMVISRNLLAVKEAAQDLCSAVQFDKAVHKLIILCVNVTSKGYDGESVDEIGRGKLNEVTELCKWRCLTMEMQAHAMQIRSYSSPVCNTHIITRWVTTKRKCRSGLICCLITTYTTMLCMMFLPIT